MPSTRASQQHQSSVAAEREDLLRQVETQHPLEMLQSQIGNAGLVAMLARAQPKLMVGDARDPAEVEADSVARDVVSSLGVQRGGGTHHCAPSCSHGAVARSAIGLAGGDLDTGAEQRMKSAMSGGGRPLPEHTRTQMEGAFGADFGGVRVHADQNSAQLASSMSARAFTLGGHIFLGPGQRTDNHELMAHELTHTIQQGASVQHSGG